MRYQTRYHCVHQTRRSDMQSFGEHEDIFASVDVASSGGLDSAHHLHIKKLALFVVNKDNLLKLGVVKLLFDVVGEVDTDSERSDVELADTRLLLICENGLLRWLRCRRVQVADLLHQRRRHRGRDDHRLPGAPAA